VWPKNHANTVADLHWVAPLFDHMRWNDSREMSLSCTGCIDQDLVPSIISAVAVQQILSQVQPAQMASSESGFPESV
jgi:hypothetical protein